MAKISTSISIDADVKAQAQELFAELGLDLSTAVNLFLRQCIYEDGIPFLVSRRKRTESGFPAEEPTETLHAQWDQLDNVTEPGQQQEWRLRVSHPTGQPADAQAMVTLYDSALDLINDNTWNSSWELRDDLPTSYTQTLDNDELIKGETGRPKQLAVPDIRPAIFADGLIRISFDKTVEVMKQTGHDLPSLYRETSEGGLAAEYGK